MERIVKISLGKESSDGMKYKLVQTTAGNFKTRCCAYNQTLERFNDKHRADTSRSSSSGPPIKIVTLKYDAAFRPRQKFLFIKQLTESYKTRKEFYGCDIFLKEIDYLKDNILSSFDKVVLVNYRIPTGSQEIFNKEDILTMVRSLILTETPHLTIPFLKDWSPDECINVLEELKKDMLPSQDYFVSIHPFMDILNQKIVIESLKKDDKFRGLMMSCYTPFNANNAAAYNQASRLIGNDRLLISVDVDDNPRGKIVSLPLLLRMFNIDITCRNVRLDLNRDVFDSESKKSREKIKWYVPALGGLLSPDGQRLINGISLDEILAIHYLPQLTNMNYRELSMLYNFIMLNQEGKMERRMIDEDDYPLFLKNKPALLKAFEGIFLNTS